MAPYLLDVWGRQVWLGFIHTPHLLENIHTAKIDGFTKWDKDRLTEFESILTIVGQGNNKFLPWLNKLAVRENSRTV